MSTDYNPTIDAPAAFTTFAQLLRLSHLWNQAVWRSQVTSYKPKDVLELREKMSIGANHTCGTSYCFAGLHAAMSPKVIYISDLVENFNPLDYGQYTLVPSYSIDGKPMPKEYVTDMMGPDSDTFAERFRNVRDGYQFRRVEKTLAYYAAVNQVELDRMPTLEVGSWVAHDLGLNGQEAFNADNDLEGILAYLLMEAAGIEPDYVDEALGRTINERSESERELFDPMVIPQFREQVLTWLPGLLEIINEVLQSWQLLDSGVYHSHELETTSELLEELYDNIDVTVKEARAMHVPRVQAFAYPRPADVLYGVDDELVGATQQ